MRSKFVFLALVCILALFLCLCLRNVGAETLDNEGNKICPVSGQKVDGKNFFVYDGKRYGMCCPVCAAAFKADPKKYSAIADKEVAGK